ncbi:histone acetyltransferase 1 [Xylographa carneopallida]|nr:histone acetyltransferase 1 [Xylographa carneopallida]
MDDLGRDTNDPEVEPVKQRLVKQRLVKHVLTRIRRFLPMNMEDQDEEWSSNANEAIQISIVQPGAESPKAISTFHPQFTYSVFGDEERIFGYQGLAIKLRFAAHDLYPHVSVSSNAEFKTVGDTKATDVVAVLEEHLPSYAFRKSSSFKARIQKGASADTFNPPGQLIESYSSKGRNFEIWCGELTDASVRLLLERMQIFIAFFIEGGTALDLDDQEWTLARWRVFFVYEKLTSPPTPTTSAYSIVGYSTSYRFLTYQPTSPSAKTEPFIFPPPPLPISSLPCRARISQFLILPPHQSHSHGTHLYAAMIRTFLADAACTEITVEDPNEAFDDLRDYCDHARLRANGTLAQITLRTDLDPKATAKRVGVRVPSAKLLDKPLLRALRLQNKLAPRQFDRLVELHLLSQIPAHNRQAGTARLTQRAKATDEGDRAYYYWRLLVKQRIYKKNKDVLMQLDRAERIDKVEEALGEQGGDYERLLRGMEGKGDGDGEVGVRRERGKRKVVDDDEDADEDEDGGDDREAKRTRMDEG